jgi:hypothetical protein
VGKAVHAPVGQEEGLMSSQEFVITLVAKAWAFSPSIFNQDNKNIHVREYNY